MNEGLHETADTPVVAGFIHGLRVWNLAPWRGGFQLTSATGRFRWDPDSGGQAVCRMVENQHRVPSTDCSCGFYSFHQSQEAIDRVVMRAARSPHMAVAGIVRSWGRTEVHADGMRSEYAKPEVLFIPDGASPARKSLIFELAGMYGAAVWDGPLQHLFDRMTEQKPGLSATLTRELIEGIPETTVPHQGPPGTMRRKAGRTRPPDIDRLIPITPAMSRKRTDTSGRHPLQPEGYWLAGSKPWFRPVHFATNSGNKLVRLRGIRQGFHWRHAQPFPAPGSRVQLRLNSKDEAIDVVTCQSGLMIGRITGKPTLQILADDPFLAGCDAWILCGWRHPDRSPGSPPQGLNIVVPKPGNAPPRFPHPHSGDDEGT